MISPFNSIVTRVAFELAFGPSAVVGRNFADGADQTRGSVYNGDEMPYRPILLARLQWTADNTLCTV